MANYTVTGAKHAALAAGVVDTVTITGDIRGVEILNRGAAELYFTIDGSTPGVGGDNTLVVVAGGALRLDTTETTLTAAGGGLAPSLATTVKLIASATVAYSVTAN